MKIGGCACGGKNCEFCNPHYYEQTGVLPVHTRTADETISQLQQALDMEAARSAEVLAENEELRHALERIINYCSDPNDCFIEDTARAALQDTDRSEGVMNER